VRLSAADDLVLLEAAEQANIAVGALIRECVRRAAYGVAADASAGRLNLRRRSASVPVPAPAAVPSGATNPRSRRDTFPEVAVPEPPGEIRVLHPVKGPIEIPKDGAARAAFFRSLQGGKP
jgi:hypothetical protein